MNTVLEKLATLHNQQLIETIDVEFCSFLHRQDSTISDAVLIAACLVSNAYRGGDVCLPLKEFADQQLFREQEAMTKVMAPELAQWVRQLKQSRMVGEPGDFTPLIMDEDHHLYLHKIWHYEQQLAMEILSRAQKEDSAVNEGLLKEGLERLFMESEDKIDWQKAGAIAAVYNHFTVISGGPGTGKTTTVVRFLALILEQARKREERPAVALAAPTGKAAKRLQYAIMAAKEGLNVDEQIKQAIPTEAITLHQLLGARQHSSQFRYNAENPLPYDLVIVDEASMVDQALMSKLMAALLENTKLVLLGDKDQLASVEAGAVLGDICGDQPHVEFSEDVAQQFRSYSIPLATQHIRRQPKPLTNNIILLTKSYRFSEESGIRLLADAINGGEEKKAIEVLQDNNYPAVNLQQYLSYADFMEMVVQQCISTYKAAVATSIEKDIFKVYNRSIILSAHRRGPWGTQRINHWVEAALHKKGIVPRAQTWYHGKPVMITQNDYTLGLNNGDFGICLSTPQNTFRVVFERADGLISLAPSRLPAYSTAFALTVHKSQGSEFEEVMLVLPQKSSKILSRELLYTAVTRSKKKVTIIGKKPVISKAIQNTLARHSGLEKKLWLKKRGGNS